jgi:hypothetical protein
VLSVALRGVLIESFDILELFRATPRGHRGALLLGPPRCPYRRAAVGVRRLARVLRRDGCWRWCRVRDRLDVAGRDQAFLIACPDSDPAGASCRGEEG